jgi:hypothetical protein
MSCSKETPFLDFGGSACDGCSRFNVPLVRVGSKLYNDPSGRETASLCRACLEKALRCHDVKETRP